MLAIRMQRLGRKGHPTYRVVVQDSRRTPTSGKVVASLGSYDPHTKQNTLVKDKAQLFLDNGAQPSERVVRLFMTEGITLPKWVKEPSKQSRTIRNSDKLRRNRPAEEKVEEPAAEAPVETVVESSKASEAPQEQAEVATEAPFEEIPQTAESAPENVAENSTETEEIPEKPVPVPPGEDAQPEDSAEVEKPEEPETIEDSKNLEKESKEKS